MMSNEGQLAIIGSRPLSIPGRGAGKEGEKGA
jgi:hypothetical protein